MKKLFGSIRSNKDGSVLLAVLTIMSFATILAATAFSFVSQASKQSYSNYNEKQAYYTASTCLETFVDSVLTPGSTQWDTFVQVAQTGATSTPVDLGDMGTCEISIERPAGQSLIKITATATVNGKQESVVCYLKENTVQKTAKFTNAIELTGSNSAGYNNLNVIGDMAGSNDSNELDMFYSFDNNPVIYGQFFQYGSIENHNHLDFQDSISGEGTSLTATQFINFTRNDTYVKSNIKKENNSNSNYVNAGEAFTTNATHTILGADSDIDAATGIKTADIDLFAGGVVFGLQNESSAHTDSARLVAQRYNALAVSGMVTNFGGGNDYVQYGNVYCYDNGGIMGGDMVVDSGSFKVYIYGDVYVEGDLYITTGAEFHVYGNLFVNGTITGTPTMHEDTKRTAAGQSTGKIYNNGYGGAQPLSSGVFTSVKSARGATPTLEYEGTEYIYHAEDILISDDTNVSTISTKYKEVVNNKDAYYLSNYTGGDYEGIHFDKIITGNCYISKNDLNSFGGRMSILVKVTEKLGDIIIVMENGLQFNNGKKILVKNETKHLEASSSGKPSFCYFTVDTYTPSATVTPVYATNPDGSVKLDSNGKKIVIDSNHSGFVTGATVETNSDFCILDYDTWKNSNVGVSVGGVSCGTKQLNLTGAPDTANSYSPGYGYIIYLLTEGTTIKSNNPALFEGTFYARQASLDVNNGFNVDFYLGTVGGTDKTMTGNTFAIGSVIVGQLTTRNAIYCAYCPPSDKSDLSNVGGGTEDDTGSYEILKYTQDLS